MQEELRGLEIIKNDAQVMKMRNKLNMRVARYTAYKLRQELLTLKKELRKIRKEYKKAGKGSDIPHIEMYTLRRMVQSHPAGRLIKKLTYEPRGLLILMGKSNLHIQKLISQQILTPEFDDNIFKEEFGDKTVTRAAFKAAQKSYMKRISAKLFDEDKFLPAKNKEKIPYLEKCRKDFKKACLRGIPLLPITLPVTAIVLTTYAAFTLVGGVVWACEKVSDANARMLGKKTRGEVRQHDKSIGRKPKLFGDYKRVAFPVLQSAIAIVTAGAFAISGTNEKDTATPDMPAPEPSVAPLKTPIKKEAEHAVKNEGIYIMPFDKLTSTNSIHTHDKDTLKGTEPDKIIRNDAFFTTLKKSKNKQLHPQVAIHLSKIKNKNIG